MGTATPLIPLDVATFPGWGRIFQGARKRARLRLDKKPLHSRVLIPVELRINGHMRALQLTFLHVGFRSSQPGIPTPRLVSVTG